MKNKRLKQQKVLIILKHLLRIIFEGKYLDPYLGFFLKKSS